VNSVISTQESVSAAYAYLAKRGALLKPETGTLGRELLLYYPKQTLYCKKK